MELNVSSEMLMEPLAANTVFQITEILEGY